MSKAKTARRTSAATKKAKTVEEYFSRFSGAALTRLKELRTAIRTTVPRDSSEVISYGIPAFRHKRVLVWYAAFSDHCSLFPTAEVIAQFDDELSRFSRSKGTIHFPLDRRIPAMLVKKLVKARVARAVK